MQSQNNMGGMNGQSLQDMQQRLLQQQQQQQQMHAPQAQMIAGNQFAGGMGAQSLAAFGQQGGQLSNSALAMMQQQANTQPNNMMVAPGGMNTNNNMMAASGNWNAMTPANVSQSPMDASSGSSARLMASMGVGGMGNFVGNAKGFVDTSPSSMQNMQVLFQHQQQAQAQKMKQQQPQIPNPAVAVRQLSSNSPGQMGNPNPQTQQQMTQQQMMLQRQLASMQNQAQGVGVLQQQQGTQMHGMPHPQGSVAPNAEFLQAQQQQQLYQQMKQQQQGMVQMTASGNNNEMMGMMQQTSGMGHQQPVTGSMGGGGLMASRMQMQSQNSMETMPQRMAVGSFNDQHLRVPQQMTMQDTSQLGADSLRQQQSQQLTNQNLIQHQQQEPQRFNGGGSVSSQQGSNHSYSNSPLLGNNPPLNDSSVRSHSRNSGNNPMQDANSAQSSSGNSEQKAFLDGSFAGGWQSNADLPDRREVIFRILEVIRHMRPDTDRVSSKLPHMAKSLEEHLYRSAQTKEEYMDFGTLRRRLQAIAHGLELHRPSSSNSQQQGDQSSQTQSMESGRNQSRASFQTTGNSDSGRYTGAIHSNQDGLNLSMNSGSGMAPVNQSQMSSHMQQMGGQMNHSASFGSNMGGNASAHSSMGNLQQRQTSSQFQTNSNWTTGSADYGGNMVSDSNTTPMSLNTGMVPMTGMGLPQQQMQSSMIQQQPAMSSMMPGPSQIGNTTSSQAGAQHWNPHSSSSYWDTSGQTSGMDSSMQKKKVILQQQQRLLLLRHASKCTAGAACQTRFCSQMVTLWRHMKACRDKNCKTPHCVSSRCVLNHYRICKSNGKTATCEVCGPVMMKINQKEMDAMASDPLTRDQDLSMKQPYQSYQQQSMQQQNAMGQVPPGLMNQNVMQPVPVQQQSSVQPGSSQHMVNSISEGNQLQQVQQQQLKLKQQLDSLNQLQKKQEELEKQQKRLEMHAQQIKDASSPQAQQLQQQQMLLGHLQKKCQQQQLMLQQEVKMLMNGGGNPQHEQSQMPVQSQVQQQFQQQLLMQQQGAQGNTSMGLVPSNTSSLPGVQSSNSLADGHMQGAGSRKSPVPVKPRLTGGKGRRGGKGKSLGINTAISKKRLNEMQDESYQSRKRTSATKIESELPETVVGERKPSLASGLDDTSLIPLMTRDEIMKHLESLNKRFCLSSRTVTHKCLPIVQALIDDQFGWVFHDPVDPVTLGLPDYFDVVKTPMCLELVKKKLENAIYNDTESFARDLRLVFENAILYNGESSEVGVLAKSMLDKFHAEYRALVQELESSHLNLEKKGELCSLCGNQNRKFEPTVLYCQGSCKMQRIKRHATYYTDWAKQNFWCDECFKHLKDDQLIMLDDGTEAKKSDLQECKNDALPEEGWVNCDHCNSWVHQICSLFNGRVNKTTARYTCPNCYLSKDCVGRVFSKQIKVASDLPHCKMSEAIESGLLAALEKAYKDRSEQLGLSIDNVEKAEPLSIRVVSNTEKKHLVGKEMFRLYKYDGCVKEYPVRTKCIALFQKIHGADTLLFAMYVYEYGQECPAPNRRRVYVSYLDSVQYFEPKCYRTFVYHTILMEYLRYVKNRGFHTAHIWSCPPTPGDDYIFHVHPSHQLIPREDMLRAWYHDMLDRAKAEGIVIRTTTLYDEYFVKGGVDSVPWATGRPTCLPYFEGDYIPGEIETIIKLEEEKNMMACMETSEDAVMTRLGLNLRKMKDNFIVVHLRSRRFAAAVERGENVDAFKDDSDEELVRSKRAKISGKDTSLLTAKIDVVDHKADCVDPELHSTAQVTMNEQIATASSQGGQSTRTSEANQEFERKGSKSFGGALQIVISDSARTTAESNDTLQQPICDRIVDSIASTVDQDLPNSMHRDGPSKNTELNNVSANEVQLFESDMTSARKDVANKPPAVAALTDGDQFDQENKNDGLDRITGISMETAGAVKADLPESGTSTSEMNIANIEEVRNRNELESGSLHDKPDCNNSEVPYVDQGATENISMERTEQNGLGFKTNQEKVRDCVTVDHSRVDGQDDEANETGVLGGEQSFVDESMKSKQISEPDDTLASKNETLGSDIDGSGLDSKIKAEEDVPDETRKRDEETVLSYPVRANQETNKDEAEIPDGEAIKADAVPVNPAGDNKDEAGLSGSEAIKTDVPANLSRENQEEMPVAHDKAYVLPANADPAEETLRAASMTNHVSEVDNERQVSQSDAALENPALDQVFQKSEAGSMSISNSDRERLLPISGTADQAVSKDEPQVLDGDAVEDELPSNLSGEISERERVTANQATGGDNEIQISQSEAAVENLAHDQALSISECGIMASEKLQNPGVTSQQRGSQETQEGDQGIDVLSSSIDASAQQPLKRGIEDVEPLLSRHFDEINRPLKYVMDTADPDEPIEVELFESRQRFLNYCQSSHCQFDELRRAKHSTMMVLFQLHNPAAPLFLQQCGACYRDITHGVRYNCNNCSKFDLCEECYKPVTSGLWAKRDSRFEHDPSHTFTPIDMEVSADSAMNQEDRQRALKAHCALLEHAGSCEGAPACSLQNCQKMKKLFNHVRTCEIKPKNDCRICTRLISLCAIHARTCIIAGSCPVPFCDRIRDRNERLQRQQQLMDDRRRQAQNDLYHTS